jgi:hypothetical protein
MITYLDIALFWDCISYAIKILFFLYSIYVFYGIKFSLESDNCKINIAGVFALIPIYSIYNNYSKFDYYYTIGFIMATIDFIMFIIRMIV